MSTANVLVVDDEADIRGLLEEILTEEGFSVRVAADAAEARRHYEESTPDLVLLDIWMPDTDGITLLREWSQGGRLDSAIVMMSGHGTVETAVEATRLGAVDFVEKPLSLAKLLRTVQQALEGGPGGRPARGRQLVPPMVEPIGKSAIMHTLREDVKQVAPHDAPVLFVGEPGTGREAFARYLHSLSARASGPFVALVASGLSDSNAENQLLGSESGESVDAGSLERARGGVLYISELEDLCETAQSVLLGALERGSFVRKNGALAIRLDVRVVSSARPGIERNASGKVRQDLLSLINVVSLRVPPLREYAEDVPELLRYYVDKLVDTEGLPYRRFSVAAQNRLRNYPWPGNVRDLKNMVHRLLMLDNGEVITLEEVETQLAAAPSVDEPLVKQDLLALPLREAREQFERAYLQQQLILCGGKVGQLAKRVGMERTHLYRKLRSLGVDFRQTGGED